VNPTLTPINVVLNIELFKLDEYRPNLAEDLSKLTHILSEINCNAWEWRSLISVMKLQTASDKASGKFI